MSNPVFHRKIMKFLLPVDINSIGTDGVASKEIVPLYINPQNIQITEGKLITDTMTKGGYVVQYWGEKLIDISVSGTTGSGGIEAINILRSVYRHEQIIFKDLMIKKAKDFEEQAIDTITDVSSANASSGLMLFGDALTGGGLSSLVDGVSSTIDYITDAASGSQRKTAAETFRMPPTLASFATSIDMYYHGVTYRGYFMGFTLTESANSPGIFEYSFQFKATKKSGLRSNFMPWHRNPRGKDGRPEKSLGPMAEEAADLSNYSFPVSEEYKRAYRTAGGILSERPSSNFNINNQSNEDPDADANEQSLDIYGSLSENS